MYRLNNSYFSITKYLKQFCFPGISVGLNVVLNVVQSFKLVYLLSQSLVKGYTRLQELKHA